MTLELKNISYKRDGRRILDDVSFLINEKKFVAIVGLNGSGKSTLAKIIMGIEKPDSGQVLLDGKDITNVPVNKRAKMGIALAFQQPVKFKGITVRNILQLASSKTIPDLELGFVLKQVGLGFEKYLNRQLDGSLSGGELKRIEIAMMLLRKSKVAIFDEAEAGIDLWSFSKLVQVLKDFSRKNDGITIVIAHNEEILKLTDEIIMLDDGKVFEHSASNEILKHLKRWGD